MKIIYRALSSRSPDEIYEIISNYITVFKYGFIKIDGSEEKIMQSAVFKAVIAFFTTVASKVKDRFGPDYTVENFEKILSTFFERIKISKISGNSHNKILEYFEANLDPEFSL